MTENATWGFRVAFLCIYMRPTCLAKDLLSFKNLAGL